MILQIQIIRKESGFVKKHRRKFYFLEKIIFDRLPLSYYKYKGSKKDVFLMEFYAKSQITRKFMIHVCIKHVG